MNTRIRTFLLVTLVTLLIWIWAEGESLSGVPVSPRVVFVSDDAGELVIRTVTDTWRGTVRMRLEGSTVSHRAAAEALSQPVRLKPGGAGVPLEPGDNQSVNLVEALREHLKGTGVTISEADPPNVVVRIIRLVKRELPVRPELPSEVEIAGEATVTPARVTVRLPESAAALLPDTAAVIAVVSLEDLRRVRNDAPVSLPAAVRLPAALAGTDPVTVTPEQVKVTLRLKRSVESAVVPSVPVWVALPPTEVNRWDVQVLDQFLRDVTITGPADLVRQIRERTVTPIAEVRLTSDELEKGVESKDAEIVGLPAGVEWSVANKAVRLKITRRVSEGGTAPGGRGPNGEAGGETRRETRGPLARIVIGGQTGGDS